MNRKTIASFAIGPLGSALVGIVTLPMLAWFFAVDDIGRISTLQVIISFSLLLFTLGLDQAYVREYHESVEIDLPNLLKIAMIPGLTLLLLACVFILIFAPFALSNILFSIESPVISILVSLCLVAAFFSRFLSLILRMEERGVAYSMSQILPNILFLILIISFGVIVKNFDFNKLLIAQFVSILSVTIILAWNTRFLLFRALSSSIHWEKMQGMMKFGFPLIFGSVAYWALMAMDKLFLRSMSTFEELGIYSVATSVAASAGLLSGIFNIIWTPTVYKWASNNLSTERIDRIASHMLAMVSAIFIISGLFSWILQFILPSSYVKVQFIVTLCMAAPLFYTLSETTAVGIGISRKSIFSMIASVSAATINLIGNYILVPKLGAIGAAISTGVAIWLFLIMRTEFAHSVWRPMPRIKLYLVTAISLIIMIGFALSTVDQRGPWLVIWGICSVLWVCLFRDSAVTSFQESKKIINELRSEILRFKGRFQE